MAPSFGPVGGARPGPTVTAVTPSTVAPSAELRRDGFCVVRGVVGSELLDRLRPAADRLGERWSEKVGDQALAAPGSMVGVPHQRDPVFGELIVHPPALATLESLGVGDASFTDGYVISKPGRSPRLFWHFDWYGWDDPTAHATEPVQVFLMYYLTDTRPENGCLRVIPGSHRRRHPVHDLMTDGHQELSATTDPDRPEFADWAGEVALPVRAGDAVVGDARLLHAAHTNTTHQRRSLITLWYQPHFANLPPAVQATLAAKTQPLPDAWPAELRERVAALHPAAPPDAEPLVRTTTGPRS